MIQKLLPNKLLSVLNFLYLHIRFGSKLYLPNLDKPSSFNEKILWMKLHYRNTPIDYFADKLKVRDYVENKIGSNYLVPLISTYKNENQIDFSKLPAQFVLKTNHGSGWNIVVNQQNPDYGDIKKKMSFWLKQDYYKIGGEWQYKNIEPKIMCEQYLTDKNGSPIKDYKVFCFNSRAKYIQIDLDRFTNHKRQFYDTEWVLQPFTTLFPREEEPIEKPSDLELMLELAERLSEGFIFLRVDFYYDGTNIYFGELTLHHGGGCEPFSPPKYDRILGDMLNLEEVNEDSN